MRFEKPERVPGRFEEHMPTLEHERFTTAVASETEAVDLRVRGALPPELTGDYVRNGPNPLPGSGEQHPFLGDGMLHGVRLAGGRARSYRNRWVRTRSYLGQTRYLKPFGRVDLTASVANTSVVAHAGRILALVESSFPYEVTRDLATVGPFDFGGRLKTPFTAHPKRCPVTGELHAYGMSILPGGLTYHRIDAAGTLIESRPVKVKRVTMMHDFALTQSAAVFFDLPVVFDLTRAVRGAMPFRWDDGYGARIGIVPRAGGAARWYAIDPCYVFHIANAYDDGERTVVDAVRYPEMWRNGTAIGNGHLHRWTIDRATGAVTETQLAAETIEFPRCDERVATLAYRYAYATGGDEDAGYALVRYDLARGTAAQHRFAPGTFPGEFTFVPAHAGAAEDHGWLLGFVYDAGRDASDLVVLDATDVAAAPVAAVELPVRVPFGFHGAWLAAGGATNEA
jgi:carotenoid cleavage dioxygenase